MEKQVIISKFLKTSGVYFFGKVATYVVSFLMIRYYTNHVVPAEYGEFELLSSLYAVIIPFFFIEIWSGLLRFTINKSIEEQRKVISTIIIGILPFIFLYSIVYFFICRYNNIPHAEAMYFVSFLFLILNLMMMVSRAFSQNTLFALSGIIGALANSATGYMCVHYFHLQCDALLYAMIANYIVQIILLVSGTKVYKYISLRLFDWPLVKKIVVFCLPFSINTILYYINNNYYRVVVNQHLGNDVLGIFVVGTKFCVIVSFIVTVFHLAWQELTFSQSEDSSRFKLYDKGLSIISNSVIVLTLWIVPFVKIIAPFFIGEAYSESLTYIPFFYITLYFTSISGFLYNTLVAEKITIFHPIVRFFSASAYMGCMYLLIDRIGVYAVVLGAVICSVIEWILLMIICHSKIQLRFSLLPFFFFIIIYGVGIVIFKECSKVLNTLYMITVLGVGVAYLYYMHKDLFDIFQKKNQTY